VTSASARQRARGNSPAYSWASLNDRNIQLSQIAREISSRRLKQRQQVFRYVPFPRSGPFNARAISFRSILHSMRARDARDVAEITALMPKLKSSKWANLHERSRTTRCTPFVSDPSERYAFLRSYRVLNNNHRFDRCQSRELARTRAIY